MTAAQLDAARRYHRARHDMTTTEPETLARAAAECAAELAREAWWTARAMAHRATAPARTMTLAERIAARTAERRATWPERRAELERFAVAVAGPDILR